MIAIIGLVLSIIWVKGTNVFVEKKQISDDKRQLENVFIPTTFQKKLIF